MRGYADLMLVSSNRFAEAGVELCTHFSLEPTSSLFYLRHRGLVYDGDTQPCSLAPTRERSSFYMLLEGELALSTGVALRAPANVRMREDVLEGALGTRPASVRASGEPHVSIALHVTPERVARQEVSPFETLTLSSQAEATARAYADLVERNASHAALAAARASLVDQLVRERLLQPFREAPLGRTQRIAATLGNALSMHFARLDTAPTIAILADLSKVSPRTTDRLLKQFTETYGLPNEGLRDLARRWRLKLATLLLSSPALSVRRVAKKVGYRNAEALANALAAEGLPPPSQYRQYAVAGANS